MGEPLQWTPEEVAEIKQKTLRDFRMGSTVFRAHYDEEKGILYVVDDNNNLTGKHYHRQVEKKADIDAKAEDAPIEAVIAEPKADAPEEKKPKLDLSAPETKKKILGITIVVLVAAAVLFFVLRPLFVDAPLFSANSEKAKAVAEETVPDTGVLNQGDEEDLPYGYVQVIQANRDLLKGDVLTEDDLQRATITIVEYNQLLATGVSLCRWSEIDAVLGMHAASYIPTMQFVASESLSVSNPIQHNPWQDRSQDSAIVTIPYSSFNGGQALYIGAYGDLDIARRVGTDSEEAQLTAEELEEVGIGTEEPAEKIVPSAAAEEGPASEEPGVAGVAESYVINNYHVEDVLVADILNADGESVYPFYAQYIELPVVKQKTEVDALTQNDAFKAAVKPAFIVILIKAEQVQVLGSMDNDALTLTLNGRMDDSTEERAMIAKGFQGIANAVEASEATVLQTGTDE